MATKICKYCAAEYDDMLSECPYCESTNYKGAEAEYLNQLEDVREDMEELKEVPQEETQKAFRKQGKFLVVIFAVVAILILLVIAWRLLGEWDFGPKRDVKQDYIWREDNYPIMNELYENGDYAALAEYVVEGNPVGTWEHIDFYTSYNLIMQVQEKYALENAWEQSVFDYALILQDEWRIIHMFENSTLDEQEQKRLEGYVQEVQNKFDARWKMSDTDYEAFTREAEVNYGWISLDGCEEYVEKWLETKE